jgi:histidinol-phosphate/aromatic aminotransferase/cobyric acid decarboxylase-like protein
MAGVAGVALDDAAGVREFVTRNRNERQEFFNDANGRMPKPIDSQANFVISECRTPGDRGHRAFPQAQYPDRTPFSLPVDTYIRVSLGSPEEMRVFWQTWDLLPWTKMFMHH